jgi:hypothetical protein
VFVTVSSKVSAEFRSSMTRGLAGCNVDLRQVGTMLTHQPLEGEDARTAVLTRPRGAADGRQRPGAVADRLGDGPVGDDATVADDHGRLPSAVDVRLT